MNYKSVHDINQLCTSIHYHCHYCEYVNTNTYCYFKNNHTAVSTTRPTYIHDAAKLSHGIAVTTYATLTGNWGRWTQGGLWCSMFESISVRLLVCRYKWMTGTPLRIVINFDALRAGLSIASLLVGSCDLIVYIWSWICIWSYIQWISLTTHGKV